MLVKEILAQKGSKVCTVRYDQTIRAALEALVENKIGAVLVFNDENIVGVLSERDIMRKCYSDPKTWAQAAVHEVMTKRVIMVTPESDLEEVMALMTDNRIRHIPVMENKKLVGIVSIGDVVKTRLKDTEYEMQYIKDYMASS